MAVPLDGGAVRVPAYAPVVTETGRRGHAVSRMLDRAEAAPPLEAVEAVTRQLGAALDATKVSFLILDLSGRALVRLAHVTVSEPAGATQAVDDRRGVAESAVLIPFDGGPVEQVLRHQQLRLLPPGESYLGGLRAEQWTVLAPVTERGEVLGLLEMSLPEEPSADVLDEIARTAHLLAFVVIANRRHTDLFEWGQRSTPFTLPAEIQRRLLPAAFTCEGGSFTLSAWLEPAANVGGDTFDYSVDRDVLHLSITDAMGHGVASALTATLCVGSLRNTRREGSTLVEQALEANVALSDYAGSVSEDGYVTGLLGRLDLRTGVLTLVNAGHVPPFLARAGEVAPMTLTTGLPMGMFHDEEYSTTDLCLQPGDRVVFVTDGMLERNAAALDLIAEISQTCAMHPREATRRLADDVLAVTGPDLADDATLLVLDWHGHHGRDRTTQGGADASLDEVEGESRG
jgi:serine phosphatase RsbU (regulator of sigma subunit)